MATEAVLGSHEDLHRKSQELLGSPMFPGKIPETNPRKFEILGIPGLEQRLVPRKSAAAHLVQLAGPRILILGHRSPRRAEPH